MTARRWLAISALFVAFAADAETPVATDCERVVANAADRTFAQNARRNESASRRLGQTLQLHLQTLPEGETPLQNLDLDTRLRVVGHLGTGESRALAELWRTQNQTEAVAVTTGLTRRQRLTRWGLHTAALLGWPVMKLLERAHDYGVRELETNDAVVGVVAVGVTLVASTIFHGRERYALPLSEDATAHFFDGKKQTVTEVDVQNLPRMRHVGSILHVQLDRVFSVVFVKSGKDLEVFFLGDPIAYQGAGSDDTRLAAVIQDVDVDGDVIVDAAMMQAHQEHAAEQTVVDELGTEGNIIEALRRRAAAIREQDQAAAAEVKNEADERAVETESGS